MNYDKMGKLEFCLDCQDDFGILNYNDDKKYIIFDGKNFLCNTCKEKLDKMEENYEKSKNKS
jgi:hypothetical protein